ncbi:hypothetical protein Cob_v011045 [Colletotrichum orbiculare MAFF 240422]|uniref:Uncharacterized protein n=1 Tax=Colletotrichum orbiculare (strain 104-T / ATCC 96160 / CBS 514.97 / LARS 414 / MAFF 240422) TaxID=1213857 RepID=A0A484FDD9_COLOR|nr:hypothetical protein Cob_v011045 [Colletotrichum orbiculare MAFF 240422]
MSESRASVPVETCVWLSTAPKYRSEQKSGSEAWSIADEFLRNFQNSAPGARDKLGERPSPPRLFEWNAADGVGAEIDKEARRRPVKNVESSGGTSVDLGLCPDINDHVAIFVSDSTCGVSRAEQFGGLVNITKSTREFNTSTDRNTAV